MLKSEGADPPLKTQKFLLRSNESTKPTLTLLRYVYNKTDPNAYYVEVTPNKDVKQYIFPSTNKEAILYALNCGKHRVVASNIGPHSRRFRFELTSILLLSLLQDQSLCFGSLVTPGTVVT